MREKLKNSRDKDFYKSSKDYAGTEASPYREWLDRRGDHNQEHEAVEPLTANPDGLGEDSSPYYKPSTTDYRLDLIKLYWNELTEKQREVIQMIGYEGRSLEHCAIRMKLKKSSIQGILTRVRKKFVKLLEIRLQNHIREG